MRDDRWHISKSLYFILSFCFLFVCLIAPVRAEEQKVVRVGWYEDSYNITGENGERSGYGYEYQQAVAAYTGWKYEYVKAGWSELLSMLQQGEIDLLSGVSYTPERAEHMLFSELPMGQEHFFLYADLDRSDISAFHLDTLNGKRVGMLENSVQATSFMAWEEAHHLHTIHVPMSGFEDAMNKLHNDEIDCLVSAETPILVEEGLSSVANVGGGGMYFVVNQSRPDLKAELDDAMRHIEYAKPFFADQLHQQYLSAVSAMALSKEERDWLASHGPIRIGWLDPDFGVSYTDKEGHIIGVINDYVKFAKDALGTDAISFTLVRYTSGQALVDALKAGDIDMIFHYSQNPYAAERNGFALSNTVLSRNMAAVTALDYFDENAPHTVGIRKDKMLLKHYISYNYPKWKVVEYDTFEAVGRAVRNGEVDCFIGDADQLSKTNKDHRVHSILLTKPGNTAFAIRQGQAELLSILDKTLKNMPVSLLNGALSMYDNALKRITMGDFVKDNLLPVATISISLFLLILYIIYSSLRKSRKAEAQARKAVQETQVLNEKLQDSHEKLQKALQQAEEANAAKTVFLFNMSHDIRTPMNAILGYTQLMKQELTSPKLLDYQKKMEHAGQILLSIINNVLDMARIESGKMELDEEYVQADSVLDEVYDIFEGEAQKKNITLLHDIHITHPHILCDRTKIQEIFNNLVSNAIKYTQEGGTVRICTQELPSPKEGYVRIQTDVIDNGIGMSREYLPTLFEPFTRERNTTKGKVAGTGLGMAIVRKLVDLMGGTITVQSELGKGSTFSVTLDHRIADEIYYTKKSNEMTKESQAQIQGKHILLAEDNDLNAEIAIALLEQMGLSVDRVADGVQCVSQMEEKPAGTYDLILMDVQMPNMDGYKATQAIRRFADKGKAQIPIIAMTANAFEEDRKMALAKGMNGHIAKPIDVEKMEKTMREVLGEK